MWRSVTLPPESILPAEEGDGIRLLGRASSQALLSLLAGCLVALCRLHSPRQHLAELLLGE